VSNTSKKTIIKKKSSDVTLICLGDFGVGKTTMIKRFVKDLETDNSRKDQYEKKIYLEGQEVDLKIKDTIGKEQHRSLTAGFYRADGVIFVAAMGNEESLINLEEHANEARTKISSSNPITVVFVLSKADQEIDENMKNTFIKKWRYVRNH